MYNALQRLNAILAYSLTVGFAVSIVVALSSPLLAKLPEPSFDSIQINIKSIDLIKSAQRLSSYKPAALYGRYESYVPATRKKDYAHFNLALDFDFSPYFHWTTKQIYVAVKVEWSDELVPRNEVYLWDYLILDKQLSVFQNKQILQKYAMSDLTQGLKGTQGNLTLEWEVVPYFGALIRYKSKPFQFTFPEEYTQI